MPPCRAAVRFPVVALLLLLLTSAGGYQPHDPKRSPSSVSRAGGSVSRSFVPPSPPTGRRLAISPPNPAGTLLRANRCGGGGGSADSSSSVSRRDVLRNVSNAAAASVVGAASIVGYPSAALAAASAPAPDAATRAASVGYRYGPDWTGTALTLLSPREAAALARSGGASAAESSFASFPMGRWPDPILRRPASPAPPDLLGSAELTDVALALRTTARREGAVGLAAQQCGVDVRLVWLDDDDSASVEGDAARRRRDVFRLLAERRKNRRNDGGDDEASFAMGEGVRGNDRYRDDGGGGGGEGIFLVNPRIVERSPELDMRVWTERCLVLPPSFEASVLRDAAVAVEYETLSGATKRIHLEGELARACQHEMDHDRGVLITDHVGLDELESDDMRRLEERGHDERMALAFARTVEEASSSVGEEESRTLASSQEGDRTRSGEEAFWKDFFVPSARADAGPAPPPNSEASAPACDEECLARRRRIVEERRAMMRQSRSSTSRQEVFDLSRQRAALYNTTYRGINCPPGVPCL